jgi:hypothetical protein
MRSSQYASVESSVLNLKLFPEKSISRIAFGRV